MKKSISRLEHYVLGEYLKGLREEAGWKQAELSKMLGKDQTFVSSYEQGFRRLDALQLEEIFLKFNLTMITGWRAYDRERKRVDRPANWSPPQRSKRPPKPKLLRAKRPKRKS